MAIVTNLADARPGDIWIATAWADATLKAMGIVSKWQQEREAELCWLRASLEADFLPDWCIEMVMENWQ